MSRGLRPIVFTALTLLLAGCDENSPQSQNSGSDGNSSSIDAATQTAARQQATFPAQQREPGDPEQIALGEGLYGLHCRGCHGPDLRGGDLGGPNLLRSDLLLDDQHGELIIPVVQNGQSSGGGQGMPPLPLNEEEIVAVAEYIHSIIATARGQGAPPPGAEVELDILVGDAQAGAEFFNRECSGCHSVTGDLKGIAALIPDPVNLQNSWVAGRRWGRPNPDADPSRRQVMVSVSLSDGRTLSGELGRIDDFIVSLRTADGAYHSFTRHDSADPAVTTIDIRDPLQRHRELLSALSDETMHDVTAYLGTLDE